MRCSSLTKAFLAVFIAALITDDVLLAAELSCEDARLKEMLKPELDIKSAEKKCGISNNSEFENVTVTMRDGSSFPASCCAAVRFQMHEISELQLEEKRQTCAQAKAAAAKVECAGRDCLANNIKLIGDTRVSFQRLIAQAREAAKKTGEACEPKLKRFEAKIAQDVAQIKRALAGARDDKEREAILSESSMGGTK